MLAQLHDAYRAILIEKDTIQYRAAQTLLVLVGQGHAEALARQAAKSDLIIDKARLKTVMSDAAELAHGVLTRQPLSPDLSDHTQNVSWLNGFIDHKKCGGGISTSSVRGYSASRSGDVSVRATSTEFGMTKYLLEIALAIAAAGGVIAGIGWYRNSSTYRAKVVERMPRRPISAELQLSYTDPKGGTHQSNATAMDVSAGGMKVHWPDNEAPAGTVVTVTLPFGSKTASVMWSNAFYAGVMFDEHLTMSELRVIEETPHAPDIARPKSETAPEGAA